MHPLKGFTLLELMVVLIILGILAAVTIPQLSSVSADAKATALLDDLRGLRNQVQLYREQHRNVAPGYPDGDDTQTPTEAAFIDQMQLASNEQGQTAAPGTSGYSLGPYIERMPINPANGLRTVQVIADGAAFPAAGDNSHGWLYQPSTLNIRADSPDTDSFDCPYIDY